MNIGGIEVRVEHGAWCWTAGLAVDADGAPTAYAPPGSGLHALDALANAGRPGQWWGLVCDAQGEPVIQGDGDPEPGYYVSATAYADPNRPRTDPRRYVDSTRIPYVAIPPELRAAGVHLGDLARVSYRDHWSPAIVGDVGPRHRIGEGSIALARALGINASPIHGGIGKGVSVVLWPSSTLGWPLVMDRIEARVVELWTAWQAALQSGAVEI